MKISAFIIAKNEADRIAEAIASLKGLADEIIVVDSGSDDATVEISDSMEARTFHRDWTGFGEQKRFAEDQCINNWLLNIDADERISPDLATEIKGLFAAGEPEASGYIIPVVYVWPHEEKPGRWAKRLGCLRLYDRRRGRFSASAEHDSVIMQSGKTARLTRPIIHRSVRSLSDYVSKINLYTDYKGEHIVKRKQGFSGIRLITEFPLAFLKAYFLRRRYVCQGRYGFILAVVYAFHRFLRVAKVYEIELMNRRPAKDPGPE